MTTRYETVLHEVFDRYTEHYLDLAEERAALADAKSGDEEATFALLYAYAPMLSNLSRPHEARLGREDARAVVVGEFLAAVHAFEVRGDERIGTFAKTRILAGLSDYDTGAVSVPSRTLRRYFRVWKEGGGDALVARALAPSFGMTSETFDAVREALRTTALQETTPGRSNAPEAEIQDGGRLRSYNHGTGVSTLWEVQADPFATVEDRALAEAALAAVSGLERDVVRYAYGFETGDPMSDGDVAQALSVDRLGEDRVAAGEYVASRPKIQRARSSALVTMREALGVI